MYLCYFDLDQAFVESHLDEDYFLRLQKGCGKLSGKVVRLNKSLFGLEQASRTWHAHLTTCLKRIGFERCMTDIIVVPSRCGYSSFTLTNRGPGYVCSLILLHACVGLRKVIWRRPALMPPNISELSFPYQTNQAPTTHTPSRETCHPIVRRVLPLR